MAIVLAFGCLLALCCIQIDAQQYMLGKHNEARACHGVPALKFSEDVRERAQNCADLLASQGLMSGMMGSTCLSTFGQNSFQYKGAANLTVMLDDAFSAWFGEGGNYNYSNPEANSRTKNFTRIVWKATTAVACAKKSKGNGNNTVTYIVCGYSPSGNQRGNYKANVLPPNGTCPAI